MSTFTKAPGWLDWYAGPATPKFKLPPGAVDAH
ncbi:MAG: 2-pyrone-4,6-dicarboxylate hydrolase, partial [Comamonadaceae bacterium]